MKKILENKYSDKVMEPKEKEHSFEMAIKEIETVWL
jgi:hypothetical protein